MTPLKNIINESLKNVENLCDLKNINMTILDNDNVTDSYLFSTMMKTAGKIIDYDDTWFIFNYYNKSERKNITEYLKISDLKGINEIK